MNLFAVAVGAFNAMGQRFYHAHEIISAVTNSTPKEMEDFALSLAKEWYPAAEGYYGHYSAVLTITDSQIQEYQKENAA